MRIAICNGKRIDIADAIRNTENSYQCPCCGGELIIKNGTVNVPHFAHKSLQDCDDFANDMSAWHMKWQEQFPIENREVVIRSTFTIDESQPNALDMHEEHIDMAKDGIIDYWGKWFELNKEYIHRADVCTNGYVLEFQHSPISKDEFEKRNTFYTNAGYKLVWIFDFRSNEGFEFLGDYHNRYGTGGQYRWKYRKKTFDDFTPQYSDDVKVFFIIEHYLEQVTWAKDDERSNGLNRFNTSYAIKTVGDFITALNNRKI